MLVTAERRLMFISYGITGSNGWQLMTCPVAYHIALYTLWRETLALDSITTFYMCLLILNLYFTAPTQYRAYVLRNVNTKMFSAHIGLSTFIVNMSKKAYWFIQKDVLCLFNRSLMVKKQHQKKKKKRWYFQCGYINIWPIYRDEISKST